MIIGIIFLVAIIGIIVSLVTQFGGSSGGNRNSHSDFTQQTNNINPFPMDNQNQIHSDTSQTGICYDSSSNSSDYTSDNNDRCDSGNTDSGSSWSSDSGSSGGFDSSGGGGSSDSGTNNSN